MQPGMGLGQLPGQSQHQGVGEHPGGRLGHQLPREQVDERRNARDIGHIGTAVRRLEHQRERPVGVTGSEQAADRPGDIPPRLHNHGGPAIESWRLVRSMSLQLRAQHLGQQRVIPPGVPARPGRHHELQVSLHPTEHVAAVAATRQRLAELGVQDVGDRRAQQELRQLPGGAVEQLVGEQIGHHRGPPREFGHRGRDVGAVLEPGGGETQASHPALGATPQALDLTRSQAVLAERGEQLGGLGQCQRQIALAELREPAPAPPPADRQGGLRPTGQQHPRCSGKVLDDEPEILGDLRAAQQMCVLQHDDDRIGDGGPGREQPVEEL